MKWLFFGLGLVNYLLWQIIPEPTPPLDPVRLQRDIESLEAEIAKLEKTAAWVERVNGVGVWGAMERKTPLSTGQFQNSRYR